MSIPPEDTLKDCLAFPADADPSLTTEYEDIGSKFVTHLKVLRMYGTTSKDRVSGGKEHCPPVVPKAPPAVPPVDPPVDRGSGQAMTFPVLVEDLTFEINKLLNFIVSDYETLVYAFSRFAHKNDGSTPTFEELMATTIKGNDTPEKTTAQAFLWRLDDNLDALHSLAPAHWSARSFTKVWPPKPPTHYKDGIYTVTSAKADYTRDLRDVSFTLGLIMDAQGYFIPRGFSLAVEGESPIPGNSTRMRKFAFPCVYDDFDPHDESSSSSSSSSAYSSGATGYGEGDFIVRS